MMLGVLFALLTCTAVSAHIFSLKVHDDNRRVMDLGVYGIGHSGKLGLEVKSLSLADKSAERSNRGIGFTLDRVTTALKARQEKNYGKGEGADQGKCFIEDDVVAPKPDGLPGARTVFALEGRLADSSPRPLVDVVLDHDISAPGLYAIFFYNCKKFNNETVEVRHVPVSYDVRVTLYNTEPLTRTKDYLSYGKRYLPQVYGLFTGIFAVALVVWGKLVRDSSEHVHRIHHLMALLLVFKILSLFGECMRQYFISTTGVTSGWTYFYYSFLTLKGTTLFLVILLIGTGWSLVKPFLSERERKIMLAIVPLQVLLHVTLAAIEEMSEGDAAWTSWKALLLLLDMTCCMAILIPLIGSIKMVAETRGADGKVEEIMGRHKQFTTFYLLAMIYIYATRIFLPLIETMLPFSHTWVSPCLAEVAALAFYTSTGWRFRPSAKHIDDVTNTKGEDV
ncbi:hypothetical protein DIPPA_30420 [Diplonema papillatum]|nr:hypothetical protein DIPPA_30420 [Diplonema papillatum]